MNNRNNRNINKKNKGSRFIRRRKITRESDLYEKLLGSRIPRNLNNNSPFPPSMTRKIMLHNHIQMAGAAPFLISEYKLNGAFLPIAGQTPSGFNEMSAVYLLNKVITTRVRYSVANNEPAIPVTVGLIYRDVQPSTVITTFALALNALEVSPSSGSMLIGETTGMAIYKSPNYHVRPGDVLGNFLEYMGDHDYSGSSTANPVGLIWVAVVIISDLVGTNLTNGAFLDFYLEMTTRFYSGSVINE
jgi:hypothetical protein